MAKTKEVVFKSLQEYMDYYTIKKKRNKPKTYYEMGAEVARIACDKAKKEIECRDNKLFWRLENETNFD